MPVMKYYREAQEQKKQDKYMRLRQREIAQKDQEMQKAISQILCRTLRYCLNGDTNFCFYCKWNKRAKSSNGDYYKPKVPGLKVLP